MPDRILHKRSLTPGSTPLTSSLELGELAINVADGKIHIRSSGSSGDTIVSLVTANTVTTGSITATGGFTGSLQGSASYALNGGVTQIVAGTNISISPVSGVGAVTINSTGGTGTAFPYTGSAIISGSLIVTGSISATGGYSGSFSGSFFGNGSGLTGITATADTTGVEAYTWFLI